MRIAIVAVGRAKSGPARDLYDVYAKRLRWPVTLREVEESRALPAALLQRREGDRLLKAVPNDALIIALDERGKVVSSAEFAQLISGWRDKGIGDLAFLIGGAGGLSEAARRRADFILSLGRMTWPHLLVRTLLLEQLYRARCILQGHPYHRV